MAVAMVLIATVSAAQEMLANRGFGGRSSRCRPANSLGGFPLDP